MKELEKKVLDYVDEHKDELFGLLSKLIQFDSQNFITHGRELECQKYIKKLYEDLGLETEMYSVDDIPGIKEHPGYLPGRGMENRPNVTGVLYGEDRDSMIMLAAHTDTMPVGDINSWTVDPFGGVIKDGRIYGLGSGDNKFGIASSYFALKTLQDCGIKLKKSVALTAYADEEYGGGDGALGACLKYPCETYVNLDGGNYELWIAALGGGGFEINVKTRFTTDTVEPVIDALVMIKEKLKPFAARRREELHKNPLFTGSDMERSAFRLMEFGGGSFGSNLDKGRLRFVIYTDKTKEEIMTELDEILEDIRHELDKRNMETDGFKHTTRFFIYQETNDKYGAATEMKKAAEEVCGHKIKACGACLSDLSVFLPYGSESSFNFGIIRDFSLYGGAHQPDEYIECDQFVNITKSVLLFLLRHCGVA
ncbi:MAG TPA: M20/M25/M40 family metallo-hydrolase [Clostridiaceae bacterium]|nr:M20/M25/M40 family metallo-hydrolase [Clostridiaceae bacterium]